MRPHDPLTPCAHPLRLCRNEILAVGGSRDASVSVEAFLGRASNNSAFLRHKGLLDTASTTTA